jgi:hypothetical protein
MKRIFAVLLILCAATADAQTTPAPARELYRIHFFKAAPGRLPDMVDAYLSQPPAPPGHQPIIFRHHAGDDWDLLVIYPQGPKASLDANPQYTDAQRRMRERIMGDYIWHSDTYAMGPPLTEVQQALALPEGVKEGLYLVDDFTALNGHVRALDDVLERDPAVSRAGGVVRFEHLQGAGWDFLTIFRYSSWPDFGAAQNDPQADEHARQKGFKDAADFAVQLREHIAAHHDTFVGRVQ